MIHILDGQNDTILDYITLDNVISDTHRKSLEDTLETYDAIVLGNKEYVEHLSKRNRIIIPDEDETLRELIIYEVDRYRDSEGQKAHFYSHASYLELKKASIIYPNKFTGTASQHIGRNLNDTGWQAGIVEVTGNKMIEVESHTNPYEMLRKIAKESGGELRFRIEHDGQKITGRYVDLLTRIGTWRGKEVTLGKDLDTIRRIEKQDIVTALLGLGPEKEEGTRLEVLVEDKDALQRWGRVDPVTGKLHHLIEPYEIQSERTEMTEKEARQYTRTALDKRINSQVTYETTIIDLADVAGLEHEEVFFGDTIRIKDTDFIPPLYLEARIFEMERSLKQKAKKDIKLGDYIEYSEEDVNAIWAQLQAEIQRRFEKLVIVNILSSSGNTFKNGQGTSDLIASTFVNGAEYDEDGTIFNYEWYRYVDGQLDDNYHETTKSITVSASDIEGKAVYRVYVGKGAEVYAQSEVTVTNVDDGVNGQDGLDGEDGKDGIDGVNGADGKDGTDGEPGRSVVEITEQYYLSTSETTVTGGAWLDDKPPITADKHLWIRTKITYDKAPFIEYTTPIIDDSWKALQTADGKNTVIFSDAEPPTSGRKPGDTWFDEANDYVMYKFDGNNWIKAQIGEQAIVANSITALHIKSLNGLNVNDQFIVDNEGNVEFGGHLEGASGTFGEVTADSDKFYYRDPLTGDKSLATAKGNLLVNHSFNFLVPDYSQSHTGGAIGVLSGGSPNISVGWQITQPVRMFHDAEPGLFGLRERLAMFGLKSVVVDDQGYLFQEAVVEPSTTYTYSAHVKRPKGYNAGGGLRLRVHLYNETSMTDRYDVEVGVPSNVNEIKRASNTFTTKSDTKYIRVYVRGINERFVQVDGLQLVEGEYMVPYMPDDEIAYIGHGLSRLEELFVTGGITAQELSQFRGLISTDPILAENFVASDGRFYGEGAGVLRVRNANIVSTRFYENTTTASTDLLRVTSNGVVSRSTSSRRYKLSEKPIALDHAKKMLNVAAKTWFDKIFCETYAEALNHQDWTMLQENRGKEKLKPIPGLIAEDLHDQGLYEFVEYDDKGRPDGISSYTWVLLLELVKDLYQEKASLKEDFTSLLKRVEKLENAE